MLEPYTRHARSGHTSGTRLRAAVLMLVAVMVAACGKAKAEGDGQDPAGIRPEASQLLTSAAQVNVFFSHQSVGENILSGLDELRKEHATTWPISKLDPNEGQWPTQSGLWHAMLGENERPKTKIDAFAHALRSWSGQKPQVAMLKLCFVDVTDATDISELLGYYQSTISGLKTEFPSVVFGHVTVPLATQSDSVKSRIKRIVGRRIPEDAANVVRTRYNARLRELFPDDPILDLERVESSRPDGTRVQLSTDSGTAFGLAPEYASDPWGHLNARGSREVALEMARFIVAARKRSPGQG